MLDTLLKLCMQESGILFMKFWVKIKLDLPWKFIVERKEEAAALYESVFLKLVGASLFTDYRQL